MCGRYTVVSKIEQIEKRFNVRSPLREFINPNVTIGELAPIITKEKPKELQFFQFGLTPHWAKKQMYVFNARNEGERNKENAPDYRGNMGIMLKPMFKGLIRSQRCLVVADAIIEGSKEEGLSKPYLIFPKDKKRPFAMAGVWDTWINPEDGEEVNSFSIVTTPANELLQKIGHHRSPLVLPPHLESTWLNSTRLADVTAIMNPFDHRFYNANPIRPEIKSGKNKDRDLLKPTGDRLYKEYEFKVKRLSYSERQKRRREDLHGKSD